MCESQRKVASWKGMGECSRLLQEPAGTLITGHMQIRAKNSTGAPARVPTLAAAAVRARPPEESTVASATGKLACGRQVKEGVSM